MGKQGRDIQRFIKLFGMSLGYLGFAGMLCLFGLSNHEVSTLPRTPEPTAGNVCPRDIHGIVIYETRSEKKLYEELEVGSFLIFGTSFLLWLFSRWKWGPEANPSPLADWKYK